MEIFELILSGVLLLAGTLIPILIRYGVIKGNLADLERLEFVAQQAVAVAEEVGSREEMTGAQKLAFAKETVQGAFPKLKNEAVENAIHASLAFSDFASAVNKAKKKK